jgi:hypothetical protein
MSDQEEQMGEVIVTAITKKVGARNDYTYWARRFWKIPGANAGIENILKPYQA